MRPQPTEIRALTAAETRPLRHRVLRPHQPAETLTWPGDADPDTLHVGALRGGVVIGVASVRRAPPPWAPDAAGWQIRGMATAPEARGEGLGARLLGACLAHAAARGGGTVWCHARVTAAGFYERAGFRRRGEVFEMPDIGPHVHMWLDGG